ncbi:MAG: hemerythrin, partial [Deltaproteobacteria bacterium]|nr:hemerythrin [Deltaproteobacteria bacterium]
MSFIWKDNLNIGHELIDSQHKAFYTKISEFNDSIDRGDTKGIDDLFEYINAYVAEHFSVEEELMSEHGYPNMIEHKKQHAEFINE